MQNTVYVGIDISLKSNSVHIMDDSGKKLGSFSVPNNYLGSSLLVERVEECMLNAQAVEVVFGLEATSVYGAVSYT